MRTREINKIKDIRNRLLNTASKEFKDDIDDLQAYASGVLDMSNAMLPDDEKDKGRRRRVG